MLLAHCLPTENDRCLLVEIKGQHVHLCSRCVGVYPALGLGMWARLSDVPLPDWLAHAVALGLPLVGGLAWVVEEAGLRLPKAVRVVSGACIGLGTGHVLGEHCRSPWPGELLHLGIGFAVVLAVGLAARWLSGGEAGSSPTPPDDVDPEAS
jgi:hypothetical protein